MDELDGIKEFPASITVCNADGVILAMNDRASRNYEKDGGSQLIGCNLLDCHPVPARSQAEALLAGRVKNGVRRLVYQRPWSREGEYTGFVELSLEIPWGMPHFVRS